MNFVIESATGEIWGAYLDGRRAEAQAAHLCYEFAEEDAFHIEFARFDDNELFARYADQRVTKSISREQCNRILNEVFGVK